MSSDVQVLERLNTAYVNAVQNSDVAWFEQHLSDDFVNSNPDATLVDRAGFLARIARPAGIKDLEPREVKIRLFGDVAIIHAGTAYTKPDGSRASGRYTDIWTRQRGSWRCVAAHVTRG
jgi:ketosteroid isomerase-like protein